MIGRQALLAGGLAGAILRPLAAHAEIGPRIVALGDSLTEGFGLPRNAAGRGANLYAPLAAIPRADRGPYLLADGIHPSTKGVALLADHLGPAVQDLIRRTQV